MPDKLIFDFLKTLKKNNNREWFQQNKSQFEAARNKFETLVNLLIGEVSKIDKNITSLNSKDCTFRIYRDVRFAKDKSPYKTNFGAFIAKGGKNSGNAGYYIHIEPGSCFLGGGIYMPPANILKAVRTEILENTEDFKAIIHNKLFIEEFGNITDDNPLKSPPRGFPADFPDIDLLKYRNYTVIKYLSDKFLLSDTLIEEIINTFRLMFPLNSFINRIISQL